MVVEANAHWGFDPRLNLSELGEITVEDECDPNPVLKWDGPDHILLEIIEPDNNVTNAWFAQDDGYDEYDYPESLSDVVTELLENSGRHDLLAADTKDLVVQVNQRVGESGLVKAALDSRLKLDDKIAKQDQIFKTKTRQAKLEQIDLGSAGKKKVQKLQLEADVAKKKKVELEGKKAKLKKANSALIGIGFVLDIITIEIGRASCRERV